MTSNASLYGVRPTKSSKAPDVPSSTTLAFTTNLTSLLAASKPQIRTSSARPRPSKSRSDIFTVHNKNSKKRALADIVPDASSQTHQQNIGDVDSATLHRSKRKMEEKSRLYSAMKRGDYVPSNGDSSKDERLALVDFDRKWAEDDAAGKDTNYDTSSDDSDGGASSNGTEEEQQELVTFEDEYGRLRKGTAAEASHEERRRLRISRATADREEMSARPARPSAIIYGDTVQSSAFNPDEPVATQMDELARKRDRSATPPPEVHYDATKEVRSKGVGFYQFSGDAEGRRREMGDLERERKETERRRGEREKEGEERKRGVEERKRIIKEKRERKMAERFLDGLGDLPGEAVDK